MIMLSTAIENGGGGEMREGLGRKIQEFCSIHNELDLTARHPLGDTGKAGQDFSLNRSQSCSKEVRYASCHYKNSSRICVGG